MNRIVHRFGLLSLSLAEMEAETLARFVVPRDAIQARLPSWREALGVDELLYLATCNRVWFLYASRAPVSAERRVRRLSSSFAAKQEAPWRRFTDAAAVAHVFETAAGLHSVIRGEREIATQIAVAWRRARRARTCFGLLDLLIRSALATAEERTPDCRSPAPSLADWVVPEIIAEMKGAPVALLGSSMLTQRCGRALTAAGHRVFAVSRSADRARHFADSCGGVAMTAESFFADPPSVAAIVAASGGAGPLIDHARLQAFRRQAPAAFPLVVDLGLPANVSKTAIAELAERYRPLAHYFRLAAAGPHSLPDRDSAVRAGLEAFHALLAHRDAGPALGAWRSAQLRFCGSSSAEPHAVHAALHREIVNLKKLAACEGVASLMERLKTSAMAA